MKMQVITYVKVIATMPQNVEHDFFKALEHDYNIDHQSNYGNITDRRNYKIEDASTFHITFNYIDLPDGNEVRNYDEYLYKLFKDKIVYDYIDYTVLN